MTLDIYGAPLSQPSRAVLIFVRVNTIQHEEKMLELPKEEHKTPEFRAINPMGLIPAIVDDGFKLFESHAILRYLATTRSVPDHWYPADPQKRATVDCILEWHHFNLRDHSFQYMYQKVYWKGLGGKQDKEVTRQSRTKLSNTLKFIEDVWLTGEEGPFLAGARQPSIADLSLICEVTQYELMDRLDREDMLGSREKIRQWTQAMEATLAPHLTDVHSVLRLVSSKGQAKRDAQRRRSAL